MNKQNIFLSENLSELAKINGFNNPCLAYYGDGEDIEREYYSNSDLDIVKNNYITAPLYKQIIDWFEKYLSIKVSVKPFFDGKNNIYRGYIRNNNKLIHLSFNKNYTVLLDEIIGIVFAKINDRQSRK